MYIKVSFSMDIDYINKVLTEARKNRLLTYPYNDNICYDDIVRRANAILKYISENSPYNEFRILIDCIDVGLDKATLWTYVQALKNQGLIGIENVADGVINVWILE